MSGQEQEAGRECPEKGCKRMLLIGMGSECAVMGCKNGGREEKEEEEKEGEKEGDDDDDDTAYRRPRINCNGQCDVKRPYGGQQLGRISPIHHCYSLHQICE